MAMTRQRLPEHLWFRETRVTICADAQSTAGALAAIDFLAPEGSSPPLHRHPGAETFLVIEGEVAFLVDGTVERVTAGESTFAPGGSTHTFRILSPEARMIVVSTPGGHEQLFRMAGTPALDDGLPPTDDGPVDMAEFAKGAGSVDVEILGPPPAELAELR